MKWVFSGLCHFHKRCIEIRNQRTFCLVGIKHERTAYLKHINKKTLTYCDGNLCCSQTFIPVLHKRTRVAASQDIVVEDSTSCKDDDALDDDLEDNEHFDAKLTSAKVALLVAYCGEKYHGVVMNKGDRQYPTVEKQFLTSMVNAKIVPASCFENPHLMRFVIASRTDKGVSAYGQIFSLHLNINMDTVHLINQHLPKDIRVIALRRTVRRFSAWRFATSRVYSYTLPTYAFANPWDVSEKYRITAEKLAHIRSIMYRYKGSHTFHNFTVGIPMRDPRAIRKIFEFEMENPFVHDSVEFVTLRIKGQSFILHQIRMMIGLMIALVSNRINEDIFVRAFSDEKLLLPIAPGSGLLLEKINYDGYDKRYGASLGKLDFSDCQRKIEAFYQREIRPSILRKEIEEKSMISFLECLSSHDFYSKRYGEANDIQSIEPDVEAIVQWSDIDVTKPCDQEGLSHKTNDSHCKVQNAML